MEPRKLLKVGSGSVGVTLPPSLLRTMGWLKGDHVGVFRNGDDIVLRNDTRRATKFHREIASKRDQRAGIDTR